MVPVVTVPLLCLAIQVLVTGCPPANFQRRERRRETVINQVPPPPTCDSSLLGHGCCANVSVVAQYAYDLEFEFGGKVEGRSRMRAGTIDSHSPLSSFTLGSSADAIDSHSPLLNRVATSTFHYLCV